MSEPGTCDRTTGHMVVVIGPSGAGKDSVISGALARFGDNGRVRRVRRVITRPEEAGGEDHRPVTEDEFAAMRSAGKFAVSWQANGLSYGIPAEVHDDLDAGMILVMNGSRSALPAIRSAFASVTVVSVTASDEILAERLAKRGRETEAEIRDRLERSRQLRANEADLVIDNSGPLAASIATLVECLVVLSDGDTSRQGLKTY